MSYHKKKNHENIPQKLQPENQFQVLLCFQKLKYYFYYKIKLLKQATYIRYVLKTIKICPNQNTDLLRFLFRGFFEN